MSTTSTNDPLEGLPRPLLLGSASYTRKLILKEMGVDYSIVVRPIDERNCGDREMDAPPELVQKVAQAKMDHLVAEICAGRCAEDLPEQQKQQQQRRQDWVILTADQVVTCNGKILEKPNDIEQAKEFVKQYGVHPCSTVGCVVLTHVPSRVTVSGVHTATIHFNSDTLTADNAAKLVDDLLQADAPVLQCAGGLMIEHPLTQQYIDRVDGTEDSVMGLCKETVLQLLQELRLKLHEAGVVPAS
jgi:septum formation protein